MPDQTEPARDSDVSISLGVVGHRLDKLSESDLAQLQPPVEAVLERLLRLELEGRPLRMVTSLAEGADRLVMRLAIARSIPVTVILPFSRDRFEHDFPGDASRNEFRALLKDSSMVIEPIDNAAEASQGYHWASENIVASSDVLLAIWNGEPGNGPGGTANTIDSALISAIPVIWLLSGPPYTLDVVEPDSGLDDSPLHRALMALDAESSGSGGNGGGRLSRGRLRLI